MEISVIVPTYNCAEYITSAIDSVLKQTYKDYEIIVVDDGSTDNTKNVLKRYIEIGKIRYFYQNNKGLSSARNTGIRLANGVFLKFLDSDDYLYPRQLELQIKNIKNANADISITEHERLYADGTRKKLKVGTSYGLSAFISRNVGPVHIFLVRKDKVIEAGYFDESLTAVEDYNLWLRLLADGAKITKVDYLGCCYRIKSDSMSSNAENMYMQNCRVFEKLNRILIDNINSLPFDVLDRLLWRNTILVQQCIRRGYKIEKYLPTTLTVISKVFILRKSSLKVLLLKFLGVKNYIFLQYIKYCFKVKNYNTLLLNDEIFWRSYAKNAC